MSDFATAQGDLNAARGARDAANLEAWQAVQTQRALIVAQQQLTASTDPNDPAGAEALQALNEQLQQATAAAAHAGQAAATANQAAAAALKGFEGFTDPRQTAGQLSDHAPLALLPIRVETRFANTGAGGDGAPQRQLWVRIYPDDISVDTFEPTLSDTEVASAKVYWQRIWSAGGQETGERAAWRGLATAHGSGRAGFIVDTYQPTNLGQAPHKADPSDEILVIGTQTPLSDAEAAAISAYWVATWRAGGDLTAEQAATTALDAAVGTARAAELIAGYVPFNLSDTPTAPATKQSVSASVAFVLFAPDPPPKQSSWSQAPQVKQFPERFVVLGFTGGQQVLEAIGGMVATPLYVGPDPSADPNESIHPDGDSLFIPDQLRWMVDFERAQAEGMGIAIDITAEQARTGFDRLLVLGVQLSASADDGKTALEQLLQHHQVGRAGLALVPQGTPTHNTTGAGTGYSQLDDPDQSFDDRNAAPLFTPTTDPLAKRDGQWVAEALGIDPAILTSVHGAGGVDQVQARAMQRALWPATLGYWMDKMLTPVFGDETVSLARWYFTSYVSGRGAVPLIRVAHQPYGILPTTAFSRIAWLAPRETELQALLAPTGEQQRFMFALLALLREIDADWTAMSAGAAFVGKPGDAHKTLLDVIGLYPASVEYYWRYSEGLTELYNIINLWGLGPTFWQALVALGLEASGEALLQRLGYAGAAPDILQHAFLTDSGEITNVVDDAPLSESTPIRPYTTDNRNYMHWLVDAARNSLSALTAEEGFTDDVSPQALLYLMLRHALMLGYYDSSYELHKAAGFLSAVELQAMKPEPSFIHVDGQAATSESRFAALFKTESRITGDPSLLVTDYITRNLTLPETAGLADQLAALAVLADAPTAQLERAFAEHIDTVSYRFDAWLLGLVDFQLQQMRAAAAAQRDGRENGGQTGGVYLGAYAWLEDLRPSTAKLDPVQLPADLQATFADVAPLVHDESNGGYIHAPSLPHARTAAVLRSGYLANASSANPDTLAVNLSSDRVRSALAMLEGVRNGQSIGALLGYQFERTLHDDFGLAEVDKFVYPLRKVFPLVADALSSTQTPPDVPIEAIEARNVIDGRKLADTIRSSGNASYPFNQAGLPPATAAEQDALNAAASGILDTYDAIADLALAEGVHQAVQGNFDRVAATTEAYSNATFPPEPEVAQTPTVGLGLTHRVALHLETGLSAPAGAPPRAVAEPALDAWLATMLPAFTDVGCTVEWTDPITAASQSETVYLSDLEIRPLDLLEQLKPDDVQAMAELDDRILRRVFATSTPRPDAALQIGYQTAPAGKRSLFEVSALVRQLRTLVQRARPLRATDAVLQKQADATQNAAVFADRARIATPKAVLDTLSSDFGTFLSTLQPLLDDPVANRDALVTGIDGFLTQAVGLLERAARFGLPQSGWGFAYEWRRGALGDLMGKVRALRDRWDANLAAFDTQIAAYDALPAGTPDGVRFAALQAAEALIAATPEPLPATPAALRSDLDAMRAAFVAKRDALATFLTTDFTGLSDALTAIEAAPPIAQFDSTPWDITRFEDHAITFAQDLLSSLTAHKQAIDDRRTATQAGLDAHDAAATAPAQAQALQAAAQAMLGESFTLIPEFALDDAQGSEWANTLSAAAPGGSLLDYLVNTVGIDRPVQEWATGAARARPMMKTWELATTLTQALSTTPAPELTPAQFPFVSGEPWLAMQFPDASRPDSDRLLYTACYTTPFDKTAHQCGLLLDEWTEVVPGTSHDTGVTFNFTRPDNEPPQAILVVTPATADGVWHWEDIVGALGETLDLAKKRALEPGQIDPTAYARFLPATIMAVTAYGISISTALAAAERVFGVAEVAGRA